jgi:hypothetical protein
MPAAYAETITIATYDNHRQVWIGGFDAKCSRKGSAVQRVKTIGIDEVRQPAAAADPADQYGLGWSLPQILQCPDQRLEHSEIAASRTPDRWDAVLLDQTIWIYLIDS